MIFAFLKGLSPVTRFFAGLAGLVLVIAIVALLLSKLTHEAEDKGEAEAVIVAQEKVLKDVETANEAVAAASATPSIARDNCLRHSRTPENCQ